MSNNPFNHVLDRTFQGQHVRVSDGDSIYEGYVDRIHHNKGSVVLHNALQVRPRPEEKVGSVYLRTVESMHVTTRQKRIQVVDIDLIDDFPAYDHDFEVVDWHMRSAVRNGFTGSFPLVREMWNATKRRYQILNGHKRIEACRRVGLQNHAVEVIRCSDEEADELFGLAHRSHHAEESSTDTDDTQTEDTDDAESQSE